MPKHNNPVPDAHFHKQWQRRVKTWFDQAPKAAKRKARRVEKAKKRFPRPAAGPLRPIVQCPSFRYNTRARLGRGFSLEELGAAKLNRHYARTIGIAVDHRRRNRSEEAFERNVSRLNEYKSKLVLYPLRAAKPRKGEATLEAWKSVKQVAGPVLGHVPFKASTDFESRPITEEEKAFRAFRTLRKARKEALLAVKIARNKEKKEAARAVKKDKAPKKAPAKKPAAGGAAKKPAPAKKS